MCILYTHNYNIKITRPKCMYCTCIFSNYLLLLAYYLKTNKNNIQPLGNHFVITWHLHRVTLIATTSSSGSILHSFS